MSAETLATGTGSSSTLLRGCEMASEPLQQLLALKEEPMDQEEIEIRREMQARGLSRGASVGVKMTDQEVRQ